MPETSEGKMPFRDTIGFNQGLFQRVIKCLFSVNAGFLKINRSQ
jgi:hypothetical protein